MVTSWNRVNSVTGVEPARRSALGQAFQEKKGGSAHEEGACIAHLHCPPAHRRSIRTTNLLERLFGEERRRMRAAGSLFGERPVLKLMYSAVIRASDSWRRVKVTEFENAQLQRHQKQLVEGPRKDLSCLVKTGQVRSSTQKS